MNNSTSSLKYIRIGQAGENKVATKINCPGTRDVITR